MPYSDQRQLPNAYATAVMVAVGVGVIHIIMVGHAGYQRMVACGRLIDSAARGFAQWTGKRGDRI